MEARVLRGEVARAGARLLDEPAAVRKGDRHDRARREAAERHLEPVTRCRAAVVPEQLRGSADRADREIGVAVVVEVRDREAAPVPGRDRADVERAHVASVGRDDPHRLRVPGRLVIGIAPFAIASSGLPSLSRSAHVTPQPVNVLPSAPTKSGRASANGLPARLR